MWQLIYEFLFICYVAARLERSQWFINRGPMKKVLIEVPPRFSEKEILSNLLSPENRQFLNSNSVTWLFFLVLLWNLSFKNWNFWQISQLFWVSFSGERKFERTERISFSENPDWVILPSTIHLKLHSLLCPSPYSSV